MSTIYERELVHLLRGEPGVIEKASRSMKMLEREKMRKILNCPFLVLRAAGSLGVDLAALRGDISFPIEVKSSRKKKVYLNSLKLRDQANRMIQVCQRCHVIPLYAYRLKSVRGDAWRMFTLPLSGLEGRNRILYKRIPTVQITKQGNFVLVWEEGMPLSDLVDYLDYL